MVGIVGSGFGLYGYLPSVVNTTDDKIKLRLKSHEVFIKRPELQYCKDRIVWESNDDSFYNSISTLILSVPPIIQSQIIYQWGHLENIKQIILEKPIAPNPAEAKLLLDFLHVNNKKIIVSYTFQYIEWGKKLINLLSLPNPNINSINIEWNFKAHHYLHDIKNWKRYHSLGGGAIRFYGIHLIALLSLIGYEEVEKSVTKGFSDDDIFLWEVTFIHNLLPTINISINANAETNIFNLTHYSSNQQIYSHLSIEDPFQTQIINGVDKRVPILNDLINELNFMEQQEKYYSTYYQINNLWAQIEELNVNSVKTA